MKIVIAGTDEGLVIQLRKFLSKYVDYKDVLDVEETKITNLGTGLNMLSFIVDEQVKVKVFGMTLTSYKTLVRNGDKSVKLTAIPTFAAYPAILPVLGNQGVESLFREITQDCVKSGKLTESIGIELGLIELPVTIDLTLGTPNLTSKSSNASHPRLHSNLGNYDEYEVWKDSGLGFVRHDVSTTADYTDNTTLPAAEVHEVWLYKAIYRYKNAQIGNWSVTVSVAVHG